MNPVELKDIVGGALQEQFQIAFEKVAQNLQNPNTPYKNARGITIQMKFTQNEARDDVKCSVSVTEKLAPQAPLETAFSIGTDLRTGEVEVQEYGKQVKGQMSMDLRKIDGQTVDTETGEIMEDQPAKESVIDFRKAKVQ